MSEPETIARLARALLLASRRALAALPAEHHEEALSALDGFLAAPAPATYVAAARGLDAAVRTHRLAGALERSARRSLARGLARLEESQGKDTAELAALGAAHAAGAVDRRAGRRLAALAALLDAHAALTGRVQVAVEQMRVRLGEPPVAPQKTPPKTSALRRGVAARRARAR